MSDGYPIKLVRDRIRDVPNVDGGEIKIWAVGSATREKLLRQKLLEEVGEYLTDGGAEELADIMEVVEALAACVEGVSRNELDGIKRRKVRERGGFMRGHVMFAYPRLSSNQDEEETP